MTSRLIENCLNLEEREYNEFSSIYIKPHKDKTTIIIFDPFAINAEDMRKVRPGKYSLVRIRRPMWGRGNIPDFFSIIEIEGIREGGDNDP